MRLPALPALAAPLAFGLDDPLSLRPFFDASSPLRVPGLVGNWGWFEVRESSPASYTVFVERPEFQVVFGKIGGSPNTSPRPAGPAMQ